MTVFKKSLSQHMTVKAKTRQIVAGVVFGIAIYVVNVNSGVLMGNATDFALAIGFFPGGEATGTVLIPDATFALLSAGKSTVDEPFRGTVNSGGLDVGEPVLATILPGRWLDGIIARRTNASPDPELSFSSRSVPMDCLTGCAINLSGTDIVDAIPAFATEPSKNLVDGIPVNIHFTSNSRSVFQSEKSLEDQLGINRCAFRHSSLLVNMVERHMNVT